MLEPTDVTPAQSIGGDPVVITWSPPSSGAPTDQYTVQRSTEYPVLSWVTIGRPGRLESAFTDWQPDFGTNVAYRVLAEWGPDGGTVPSLESTPITAESSPGPRYTTLDDVKRVTGTGVTQAGGIQPTDYDDLITDAIEAAEAAIDVVTGDRWDSPGITVDPIIVQNALVRSARYWVRSPAAAVAGQIGVGAFAREVATTDEDLDEQLRGRREAEGFGIA